MIYALIKLHNVILLCLEIVNFCFKVFIVIWVFFLVGSLE